MNRKLLRELCNLDGVSGREEDVREYILDELEASSAPKEITVDPMGNVLVHLIGRQTGSHRLLLDAHMDEVGFLVTGVDELGFVHVAAAGSPDERVLAAQNVVVYGDKPYPGVFCSVPPHLIQKDSGLPELSTRGIDIGMSGQEAMAHVRPGDRVAFAPRFFPMGETVVSCKALDNRAGMAAILEALSVLRQPAATVAVAFCVQEEVGLRGAGVAARQIRPDIAVALDATTAADTAGSRPDNAVCRVGDGGVVSFADRATLYDADLYRQIRALADEHGIPTQTKTRIAGGNNAGSIQTGGDGVRMAALSLPCRYIHSPTCTGSWADVQAMEDLLRLLIGVLPV